MLLRDIKVDTDGSNVNIHVITGLDAMGRTADNEKMLYLFNDLKQLNDIPEPILARFKPEQIVTLLANGRDVEDKTFIMSDEDFAIEQEKAAKAQAAAVAAQEMNKKAEPEQIAEGLQKQAEEDGG